MRRHRARIHDDGRITIGEARLIGHIWPTHHHYRAVSTDGRVDVRATHRAATISAFVRQATLCGLLAREDVKGGRLGRSDDP